MNDVIEFEPNTSYRFAVQAYVDSVKSWVTISMPSQSLGELQEFANQFTSEFEVKTRIKKVRPRTSPKLERWAKHVRRNRSIFEPDGYRQHFQDMGNNTYRVPTRRSALTGRYLARDTAATEQHQALEDFG